MKTSGSIIVLMSAWSSARAFLFPAMAPRSISTYSRFVGGLKNINNRTPLNIDAPPVAMGGVRTVMDESTRTRMCAASGDATGADDPDVMVFDAGGAVSWEDYKKQKPDEFKMSKVDEMQCWETDECQVSEETAKTFTKRWQVGSQEREPTMETHFDSEGEWEEENKSAWSKKWYEDVGDDDLHEDPNTAAKEGYDI